MQTICASTRGVMLSFVGRNARHKGFETGQPIPKRGKISGWSKKSRSRFRRALFEWEGEGLPYGVTCTLPACPRPYRLAFESRVSYRDRLAEWRKSCDFVLRQWLPLVERFRLALSRLGVCGFWRVELQKNQFPHLHCVIWLSDIRQGWEIINAWIHALEGMTILHSPYGVITADLADGVSLYSCKIQRAKDFSLWRYLCDHATKHKQEQLGFKGRQWGCFNRRLLCKCPVVSYDLSDSEFDMVLRSLRKLTKCHASRGRGGKSVWFTDPETIDKLIAFYKGVKDVPI